MDIFGISTLFLLLKLAFLLLVALYMVFAAIIVRQEVLMSRVVEIPFSPILRLVTLIHLFATIAVFLLAIILL